ncbi:MAG: ATP-binding cassette domain-containing protein [Desulfobacterales bacterium]|nr:ATP-binding cassette domain-containing protein [Desulfobacterales bacterium]
MIDGRDKDLIIRLFNVHKYYGSKKALIDISLDIPANDLLFILGPSGAGKTTLLKLLYLGECLSEGQILVDGINLARIPRRKVPFLRRKYGVIFQDYKLIPTKSVFENVALVLEAAGEKAGFIQKKVNSVLKTVGMEQRRFSFPPSLSGGEQQRVAFARAFVGEPKIILADEPTGSLDAESAEIILQLFQSFYQRGATIIITTHDQGLVHKIGGRALYLKQGRLTPETDPA